VGEDGLHGEGSLGGGDDAQPAARCLEALPVSRLERLEYWVGNRR
jgi:hypothetical protein